MISFLKKIRLNKLANNKLSRYFFYAIGEIALIVVGVGIALAANDFSQKQKALQQSNIFLSGMLEDLATDTVRLNRMTKELEKQLKIEQWLLDKTTFTTNDIDSIKLASSSLKWTFTINNRSFQNIQNTNDLKLFGYDALYNNISKYYLIMGNRINQNNLLETQKTINPSPFEELVAKNLYINTKEYQDYSGFGVKINNKTKAEPTYNINLVLENLNNIHIKNTLNDKFARHNYLFLTLTICDFESKRLIKQINKALN